MVEIRHLITEYLGDRHMAHMAAISGVPKARSPRWRDYDVTTTSFGESPSTKKSLHKALDDVIEESPRRIYQVRA